MTELQPHHGTHPLDEYACTALALFHKPLVDVWIEAGTRPFIAAT